MPDIKAARADLQRAYTKLINRFSPESEVMELLTSAINHLKEPKETADDRGDESTKAISRMNKAELLAETEERGIEVSEENTVAELRKMLTDERADWVDSQVEPTT
jgi:hypothetical protein